MIDETNSSNSSKFRTLGQAHFVYTTTLCTQQPFEPEFRQRLFALYQNFRLMTQLMQRGKVYYY